MTTPAGAIAADELLRLEECVTEAIHVPGAVQPHGALLALDPKDLVIRQASTSCDTVLGVAARTVLGRPVADLVGAELAGTLRALVEEDRPAPNPLPAVVQGRALDAIVHGNGSRVLVELEPADPSEDLPRLVRSAYAAMRRLSGASTAAELRECAVQELRALSGFDRVLMYDFHEDGHGEVVAEDCADGMDRYLGLHFPASDIPAQARRLYLRKASRPIPSRDYEPATLVAQGTEEPLDLSDAELRSVSPHHLQFMRNMGQAATFSLSLVRGEQLVGMITCAHRTERHIPYVLRRGYEVLAEHVTARLNAMAEVEGLTRRIRTRAVHDELLGGLSDGTDLAEGLLRGGTTLLDLVRADGVTLRLEGREDPVSVGWAPPPTQSGALLAELLARGDALPLVTSSLRTEHPDLAELVPSVPGLVVLPFGGGAGSLMFFRREVVETVRWLGDQSPENRAAPLSPRNSFAMWAQSVRDRAEPWDELELSEARDLCRDLDQVLLRRAEARLAELHGDLEQALRTSRRATSLLQTVVDTVDVAVAVVDQDARELLVNARYALNRRRATPEDGSQEEADLLMFGADKTTPVPAEHRPLRRAATGRSFTEQLVWIGAGEQQRALSVSARVVSDEQDARLTVVAYTDVTALATAIGERDRLASRASHELRTPLTSMIGYLDLALEERGSLPENVTTFLEVVLRNADRALRLVADLTAGVGGARALDRRDVRLADLVGWSVLSASPRAAAGAVELVPDVPEHLVARVDPQRFGQVLDNLLSNAVKYSPDGGRVTVRARSTGGDLVIEVIDTGIGMTRDEQRSVFGEYYRVSAARSSAIPGLGLGLAISRSIVEAHEGTITCRSEPGVGTTFTVTLPAGG